MESKSSCAMQRRRAGCLPAGRYMQICRAVLAGENTALAWSPLSLLDARGGKSKAETKALSINPHQPRPPLAPHPRISILYFSSRQIISLLLRNAACLAGCGALCNITHPRPGAPIGRQIFAHSLLVCVRTRKSKCAPQKYASAGEKRESGCKCLPRHKSALEKLFMCASECVSTDLRSSWQERKLFCFAR
jgi:hypothetical protein